jgi:hypothetical protein
VVLANLGYRTQENLTEIENALCGDKSLAGDTLVSMASVQARDWVTNRIADCVVRALGDGSSNVWEAVLAFSAFGDTVDGGRKLLDRCEDWTRRSRGSPSLPFVLGFAKAKVDRSNRPTLLRDALRRAGCPPEESDGIGVALRLTAYMILDEDLIAQSVRHLDDPEERVRLGTLRVLHMSGMRGRRATPTVLRMVQGADSKTIREQAARTLGAIGDYSSVSALAVRTLGATGNYASFSERQDRTLVEKSFAVRQAIRETMKIVNLEP